jgi:competence protein ComEA
LAGRVEFFHILIWEGGFMFQLERRHQLVLLIVVAVILFGAGYKYAMLRGVAPAGGESLVTGGTGQESEAAAPRGKEELKEIVVHVAGAVQKPGVYRLPPGSRVVDAINMAGATGDSALDYLNLAAPLEDGKQIVVYSMEEMKNQQAAGAVPGGAVMGPVPAPALQAAGTSSGGGASGLININTAGPAELEQLPGIGPSLAQRIIDYRNQNGPFVTIEGVNKLWHGIVGVFDVSPNSFMPCTSK